MSIKTTLIAAAVTFSFAGVAHAATVTETFDINPALSATQAPDTWYTDRFAPAAFESESFEGDNRLKLSLSEDDGAVDRPGSFSGAFYNTQGRKFDTPGTLSFSIDMYIDSSFASDPNRVGGLWGTGVNATDAISFYPIVEFANGAFQTWNGSGFDALGLPTGFSYDTFVNIGFSLDTVNDQFTAFAGDSSLVLGANGTTSLSNVILQGYNTTDGINRDIYFDNFTTSNAISPVPLPAALPLLLAGLGALGLMRRRKSKNV